ncbi:MAG: hypothetical protein C5B54_00265 [Acidobacteria bacterium]|nr:MAG: hypothetical protein C5B54_00265 [Acidobacteriota bacterium]
MKTTIGVMGASIISDPAIEDTAFQIGMLIAERGATLVTGATSGLPFAAARGAKKAGGEVVGFSPALNRAEHLRLGLPDTHHDWIIYTGLSFNGRNLLNVRASQGLLFIGGSIGTLNEFTIAYAEDKILGVVANTGGFCNYINEWMQHLSRPNSKAILYCSPDPAELIDRIFESVHKQFSE